MADILISYLIFVIGLVVITKAADVLVDGAVEIAKHYCIPEFIIGATIIAFGTSLPELGTSVYAAYIGTPSLAVSNVLGSNVANICLIVGVAATIFTINIKWASIRMDLIFFMFTALILLLGYINGTIGKLTSLFFVSLYFLYIYLSIRKSKLIIDDNPDGPEVCDVNEIPSNSMRKNMVKLLMGLIFVAIGAELLVHSSVNIAQYFGISERIIGLTLVALGTSLPELATSIVAALKGRSALAISNIIGSNIFNTYLVLGFSGLVGNLVLEREILLLDIPVVMGLTGFLVLLIISGKINRMAGLVLLLLYILYIGYVIGI